MTTWFVATRACYVLVEADDEETARRDAVPGLRDLYADIRKQMGCDIPIEIHTVRPATESEIELWNFHHEMLARDAARLHHESNEGETTTRSIGDRELRLVPGRRYLAARPMYNGSQQLFPIFIRDITDGTTEKIVEVLECFSYDEANDFLDAFNNSPTSFDGCVW